MSIRQHPLSPFSQLAAKVDIANGHQEATRRHWPLKSPRTSDGRQAAAMVAVSRSARHFLISCHGLVASFSSMRALHLPPANLQRVGFDLSLNNPSNSCFCSQRARAQHPLDQRKQLSSSHAESLRSVRCSHTSTSRSRYTKLEASQQLQPQLSRILQFRCQPLFPQLSDGRVPTSDDCLNIIYDCCSRDS